jgi:tetratricopeptide (TPR) repeat protein
LPTVRPSTLATHPQYQIALIHLKRQQYPAALEALCRYLEEVPHAANRSEVEQTIQRLEQAIKEGGGAETAGPAGSAAADSEGTAAAPGDPGENGRRAVPPVLDRATAKALARHVRAAVKQAEAQDLPGARAEFEQALSTAPGAPVKVRSKAWLTYLALGQALYDAGRLAEALAAYQEVLARQPPSDATAATHSLIGQIHLDQQQWEAAETDCEAALQADPNLTLAHLSLGRARLRQGRVEEALPPLQRAVQLAPDEPMTHFNLALAMQGLDRLDEAAAAYREVIRLQPDVPEPHNNLALLLKRQGRWEEAIAEYRAAIQLSPDDPVTRSNLAAALYQRGRLEEAAVEYRAILERQPREVLARCMLGRLLARQGKLDEALAELREGVRVAPNHPLPHNTLAWFHLMAPREPYRDLAAGLEEARKAVELAPENAYCLGTLGLACYRNGDYAASLQWTHRGLDASTDVDARALNLYLGSMAQAQLSNLDPAGKLYQAAVATDPNHEFRAEAEALLAKR